MVAPYTWILSLVIISPLQTVDGFFEEVDKKCDRVCAPFRVRVIQRSGQADEDAARAVLPTEGGAAEPERESVQQGISNVSLFDHYRFV